MHSKHSPLRGYSMLTVTADSLGAVLATAVVVWAVLAILAVVASAVLAVGAVVGAAMPELPATVGSAMPKVSAVVGKARLVLLVMLAVVTPSAVPGLSAVLAEELAALTVPMALAGQAEARPGYAESLAEQGEPVAYLLVLSENARPPVLQLSMRRRSKWMPAQTSLVSKTSYSNINQSGADAW
jgi:hypothetical protein